MRPAAVHRALRTLSAALRHLADNADDAPVREHLGEIAGGFDRLLEGTRTGIGAANTTLPEVGATAARAFTVRDEDTAAGMGHPDESIRVVGTPRLGLWFEIVGSDLMPVPDGRVQHVGVGLLVHHVGQAGQGDEVTVEAQVSEVVGRTIVFDCQARCGGRLVAIGTHHRVVLDAGG